MMKPSKGEWTEKWWPDWPDAGERVDVENQDGIVISGKLFVEDFFPDGDGDEVPVFAVEADDGIRHDFCGHRRWRFSP